MNYYTVRIAITVLLFILIFLINKFFIKEKKPNTLKRNVLAIGIVLMICWGCTFERSFVKFNTVEEAFKYNFPNGKIVKKYEYDDYAYLFFSTGNTHGLIHYTKYRDKWLIEQVYGNGTTQNKGRMIDKYTILTNDTRKGKIAMCIQYVEESNGPIKVKDNKSSTFEKVEITLRNNENIYYILSVVDGPLNKDYILYLNDKEYKPFR